MEGLSILYAKYAALEAHQHAAVHMWIGSWAARTSLWPMAVMEARNRVLSSLPTMSLSQSFAQAAPLFPHYALPWAILKATQWGSMAYLGPTLIKSFMR